MHTRMGPFLLMPSVPTHFLIVLAFLGIVVCGVGQLPIDLETQQLIRITAAALLSLYLLSAILVWLL